MDYDSSISYDLRLRILLYIRWSYGLKHKTPIVDWTYATRYRVHNELQNTGPLKIHQ